MGDPHAEVDVLRKDLKELILNLASDVGDLSGYVGRVSCYILFAVADRSTTHSQINEIPLRRRALPDRISIHHIPMQSLYFLDVAPIC